MHLRTRHVSPTLVKTFKKTFKKFMKTFKNKKIDLLQIRNLKSPILWETSDNKKCPTLVEIS